VAIWYILWPFGKLSKSFGILCLEKSGKPCSIAVKIAKMLCHFADCGGLQQLFATKGQI
jgi:hypothetical protein